LPLASCPQGHNMLCTT